MTGERAPRGPNFRLYIVVGLAMVGITFVLASTGPSPEVKTTGSIERFGGVCLQLERWGMFGWDILGQTYSEADVERVRWNSPPTSNPPCEALPDAARLIFLHEGAAPDVYRICGLADELGCIEFELTEFAGPPPS